MEGGKGGNSYWPGFVDALTNVVIAMIFVIVVLAIALSFAAQLMGKKVAEQIIKQHMDAQKKQAQSQQATVQTAAQAPQPSELDGRTHIAVKGNESAASAAGGSMKPTKNILQLDFADTALTLDDSATAALNAALVSKKVSTASTQVSLVALGPNMQLSENQRAAYLRVLAVRNAIIDQGYDPANIKTRIDIKSSAASPAVTISLQAKP